MISIANANIVAFSGIENKFFITKIQVKDFSIA